MTDLQQRILDAALVHIPFDGWTMSALERGARDLGLPEEEAHRAFSGGVGEALTGFSARADEEMLRTLTKDYNLQTMRIRERIATCVMVRLRQKLPHREAVRRAVGYYTLPWNAALGLKNLYATVDVMWRAAGDTSTDYNFYTKRILLSKVYMTTMAVWLDDHSPELKDTEDFLHRRIENVMQIEKAKAKVKGFFSEKRSA